jgi:hypothetical protein
VRKVSHQENEMQWVQLVPALWIRSYFGSEESVDKHIVSPIDSEQPHLDGSDRHPLVHDILATLGISKAKSDGGEELETSNYAPKFAKSDYDAASQGSNSVPEAHN